MREKIHSEEDSQAPPQPEPEPERETIQGEQELENPQPLPELSRRAEAEWLRSSWVTFPVGAALRQPLFFLTISLTNRQRWKKK
jgi:hypothetical protein